MQQEQEAAERKRLENERQASEEVNWRALEYAAAEGLRLRELARRQQEYEDQQRRCRAAAVYSEYLREIAWEAEWKQREVERVAKLEAEAKREAFEEWKEVVKEERRREKEQQARKLSYGRGRAEGTQAD